MYHLAIATVLTITCFSEIPGTKAICDRLRRLAPIWGPKCGVGPIGALCQAVPALSMLGQPLVFPVGPQVLGIEDSVVRQMRLLTAYLLLGIGGVNVLLGILRKKQIRVLRGQARDPKDEKPKEDPNKPHIAATKSGWLSLKAVVATMYASVAVGRAFLRSAPF